jgi:hypothetical protein
MCLRSSLNACVFFSGEVFLRAGPARHRVDDAADELADAAFALRRADLPAEILRDDDVGRLLRPRLGNLDVAVRNDFAPLPMTAERSSSDFVERIDSGFSEEPWEGQPGAALDFFARGCRFPPTHVRGPAL